MAVPRPQPGARESPLRPWLSFPGLRSVHPDYRRCQRTGRPMGGHQQVRRRERNPYPTPEGLLPRPGPGTGQLKGGRRSSLTPEKKVVDVRALKATGMIRQTEREYFVVRLRVPGGNLEADKLIRAAELAKKYGRGYCHFTFQQSVEVPYVKGEDLERIKEEIEASGLRLANCGPRG